ncbi:hypothetical protein ACPCC3_33050 [Streptomyces cellulosae]
MPAPIAGFRGRDASLAWCRSCHNGPSSVMSSAIAPAERPVILRSLMIAIAARDAFVGHTAMVDDQELDASRPTVHELVRGLSAAAVTRPVGRQFFSGTFSVHGTYGSAQPACCRLRGLFSLDTCARRTRST